MLVVLVTLFLLPFSWPRLCTCRCYNNFVAAFPWATLASSRCFCCCISLLAFVVATLATVICCSMARGTFAFATPFKTLCHCQIMAILPHIYATIAALYSNFTMVVCLTAIVALLLNQVHSSVATSVAQCNICITAEMIALPIPHQPEPCLLLARPSLPFWPAHLLIVAPIGSFKSIPSRSICSTHWLLPYLPSTNPNLIALIYIQPHHLVSGFGSLKCF